MKYYFYTGTMITAISERKFSGITYADNPKNAFEDILTTCKSSKELKDEYIYISKLEVIE